MSADPNTPLFILSDNDDIEYKDNPAATQAKANLAAVEHIQEEKAKQRRLEREEQKARGEAERLMWEIEEAEKQWRELEEAEVERLMQEKERLEEEKQAEQWHAVTFCGSERAAEPPEAGTSPEARADHEGGSPGAGDSHPQEKLRTVRRA